MVINKETKLYGSFSNNPGSNGSIFMNHGFEKHGINAIYKSFYSDDIEKLIMCVKYLKFGGFALSSPHKIEILAYLDEIDPVAKEIGAVNTVINNNGKLIGYNTDWIGVREYFKEKVDPFINVHFLTILGNGGFSKAVQYYCNTMSIPYEIITRENWGKLQDLSGLFFNATPIKVSVNGNLFDGSADDLCGKLIAYFQAREQFKLYTGIDYE